MSAIADQCGPGTPGRSAITDEGCQESNIQLPFFLGLRQFRQAYIVQRFPTVRARLTIGFLALPPGVQIVIKQDGTPMLERNGKRLVVKPRSYLAQLITRSGRARD